jgi:hypothetical protein
MTSSLQFATSQATSAAHQHSATTATVDFRSDMKRIIAASSTKDPSTADDTDVSCCYMLNTIALYVLVITVPNPEICQSCMATRSWVSDA